MVKIILGALGIILVVLIVAAVLVVKLFGSASTDEQKNVEKIVQGGASQALVLYQESRGNLAKEHVDQIVDILSQQGYTITLNHPRADQTYEVSDYDMIVLVSPVYAGQVAQPLLNFVDQQDFTDKKVCALLTGSTEDKGEVAELQSHIKHAASVNVVKSIGKSTSEQMEALLK